GFASYVTVIAIQFLMVPFFAQYWGAQKYGVWLMISTIPTYIALGDLGFGAASATAMSLKSARGELNGALSTFQTTFLVLCISSLITTGVCYVLVAFFFDSIVSHLNIEYLTDAKTALYFLILSSGISLLGGIYHGALRANGDFAYSPIITAVTGL